MKTLLLTLGLFLAAATVEAACTSSTYFINGRMVMCQTCCYGGVCNTTCF